MLSGSGPFTRVYGERSDKPFPYRNGPKCSVGQRLVGPLSKGGRNVKHSVSCVRGGKVIVQALCADLLLLVVLSNPSHGC